MKKAKPIIFSAFATLVLAAAICASPAAHNPVTYLTAASQDVSQTQSASGTIASVQDTSFTLTIASRAPAPKGQGFVQETAPQTMTFVIDKNTTVDGKLKVSASADVTYRLDNGNNIAINVRVTQ